MKLRLNADVGEGLETDAVLIPLLDQASIACGGHTGDATSMRETVALCKQHKAIIGAHPSYPDKANFGRRSLEIDPDVLKDSLLSQIDNLNQACQEFDVSINYIKPHGALYNDLAQNQDLFDLVCRVTADFSQTSGQEASLMISSQLSSLADKSLAYKAVAQKYGVTLIFEAFADRAYQLDGSLMPRSEPNSVYADEYSIILQVEKFTAGQPIVAGLMLSADSLCLHGDNPASVKAAKAVREILHS